MSSINVKEAYSAKIKDIKKVTNQENILALPRISKVSVNVGLGGHRLDKDMVEYISESLALITGQKVVPTRAKKAIAGFKIREDDIVGYRVTLRGNKFHLQSWETMLSINNMEWLLPLPSRILIRKRALTYLRHLAFR